MNLNNYIEYTLLKPDVTTEDINELCNEALEHNLSAVCIPPFFVRAAVKVLEKTSTKVITVIGYPMGYNAIAAKVEETKRAIDEGADELEMVINIAATKDKAWAHVRNDIDSVTTAAHLRNKKVKVIFETGLLSIAEIQKLCEICVDVQVDYIKNSTGFSVGGATLEMIEFLNQHSQGIKVIASGGIHSKEFAEELINAGAFRLGTSSNLHSTE